MPFEEVAPILAWTVYLWLLGWAVLPLSARLFPALPDRGLAAGRLGVVLLASLLAFWGGATRTLPLTLSPIWFFGLPVVAAFGWRSAEFRRQLRELKTAFVWSDAIFQAAWFCFLWVRLRHPEVNDLEKPMDLALMSAARRAAFLPFENPWFTGQDFTNYYYFGPLMGGLLARCLGTPPWFAYNLVQPAFCAFFLSVLWSACAALTGSRRLGLGAMLLVGLGGHLEPLRQIATSHHLWPLDWWSTSRVIPDTINEYPAFTLLIGDAHAHFYAFSLTALFIALCAGLFAATTARARWITLITAGVLLGIILLTNTWDAPLLGVLLILCAIWAPRAADAPPVPDVLVSFMLAPLVALPYFVRFQSQVSGAKPEFWIPPLMSVFLLWGVWLAIAAVAFWPARHEMSDEEAASERICQALGIAGGIALVLPCFLYLRGAFGDGQFRHMDTFFKFGLQAWLLLGTGSACLALRRFSAWLAKLPKASRFGACYLAAAGAAILALAPLTVVYARTVLMAPVGDPNYRLSLNAMRFLPGDEQSAIRYLYANSGSETKLVSPTGNDYAPENGRFATFTGIPTLLAWLGHDTAWGASYEIATNRKNRLDAMYATHSPADFRTLLRGLPASTVVLTGPPEDLTSANAKRAMEAGSTYGKVEWHGGTEAEPGYPVVVRVPVGPPPEDNTVRPQTGG